VRAIFEQCKTTAEAVQLLKAIPIGSIGSILLTDKDANDVVAVYNEYWNGSSWIPQETAKTANVGSKAANALSIYDMSGNALEWCWDWHGTYPETSTDYRGAASGNYRSGRGGGWDSYANGLPIGNRFSAQPVYKGGYIGFRVVCSITGN
jgi:formylglycine-generating enzyme required for sulfatase activity